MEFIFGKECNNDESTESSNLQLHSDTFVEPNNEVVAEQERITISTNDVPNPHCETFSIEQPTLQPFDTLVISGGGVKGFVFLGAIQYALHKNGLDLLKIKHFIGSSVGAMLCYLFAIGYTPIEIITYVIKNKLIDKFQKIDVHKIFKTLFDTTTGGIKNQGIISYYIIQEFLERMTLDKISQLITLKQLYEQYNKVLICTTYNMTDSKTEYLSYMNYPDMPCLIALRLSCNVPFLFEKFIYLNKHYIDGGIADNFPILKGDEIGSKIIGFCQDNFCKNRDVKDSNTLEFIFDLLQIPIIQINQNNCERVTEKTSIYKIDTQMVKMFNFHLDVKEQLDLFSIGYHSHNEL
jgi:predicted acylesterase/phospholipase RssA